MTTSTGWVRSGQQDKVRVEYTQQQINVLHYVLKRAQEDPDFFDALGGNDHRVGVTLQRTLAQLVNMTGWAEG